MIDKEAVRVGHLLKVIGHRTMPCLGIMAELDLSEGGRRNFYHNYLHPAKVQGLIEQTKPSSPTSPEQAYKLSPKGLEALDVLRTPKRS
jgi:hypothetical protein